MKFTSPLHLLGLCAVLLSMTASARAQSVALITTNTVWRYQDDGSDQGTTWRSVGFDDSGWSSGVPLFGSEPSPTFPYPWPIRTPMPVGGGRVTYYFRTHFTWSGSTAGVSLISSNYIDDGAIFYLNGTEAARVRLPATTVNYLTRATIQQPSEGSNEVVTLPAASLVVGDNVVAVEVHQALVSGTDVIFGMTLDATIPTPPAITQQPQSLTVCQGNPAAFSVTADGTAPLSYQWYFNGSLLPGATAGSFSRNPALSTHGGSYFVIVANVGGSASSQVAALAVDTALAITCPGDILTNIPGTDVVVNYPNPAVTDGALAGCAPPSGSVFPLGTTVVTCTATNACGSDLCAFNVTVGHISAPVITRQPQNQLVPAGGNATFAVLATGTPPLRYQWRRNGVEIPGATTAAFTLSNVQPSDGGSVFSVVVGNAAGSLESAPATLTLVPVASISGLVFFDLNGNGTRDAVSEYGLPQWSLQLVRMSPAGPASFAVADVNGLFTFGSLAAGTYTLSAVHPSPWFQTYPAAAGPHPITLAAGDTVTGKNFGSKLPVRVPQVEWQRGFGGSGGDRIYARAVQTADGGYLIGGSSNSRPGGVKTSPNWGASDYCVVRLDASGNQMWDASFGGDGDEWIASMLQTSDGGFILCGVSSSGVSGNKTTPNQGGYDIWLVKIDAHGNKIWDRSFGGSGTDQIGDGSARLGSVVETHDHGFLICGYSSSGADGTKTSPSHGGFDGWVIRLDADGVQLWDRSYGSVDTDLLLFAAENVDGTFSLGGGSWSGPGGNKTSANYGGDDYWLIKITSDGTPLWDRSFGGDSRELLTSAAVTADGGMALGGVTSSGISGNKTAARLSMSGPDQDGWIVRVNGNGDRVWDRSFGGRVDNWLHDLKTTDDGGFVFVGRNNSPISGNKVSPLVGGQSAWLAKTDAAGNPEWDQSFGVPGGAWFAGVTLTTDGGALLAGNVGLHNDGNITTPSYGSLDFWMVKLAPLSCASSPLTLASATADCAQHQVTVNFSAPLDPATALLPGNYLLSGGAAAAQAVSFGASTLQVVLNVPGLLPGVTYTLAVQGVADDCGNAIAANAQLTVTCPGQIRGKVFADHPPNCTVGAADFGVFPWPVRLDSVPTGPIYTFTDGAGNYSFSVPAGNYTVSAPASLGSPWNLTCPAGLGTHPVSVADGQIVEHQDFGLRSRSPTPCADLWVDVTAYYPGPKAVRRIGGSTPCCGTNFFYRLVFGNNGANLSTTPAEVTLVLPDKCTFVGATPQSTALWTVSGTPNPGDPVHVVFNQSVPASPYQAWVDIEVHLDCNPTVSCDNPVQLLQAEANFTPAGSWQGECADTSDDNNFWHDVKPCCSFDPNDCTVEPKGCGPEGYVNRDQALTYLVRFQNLGGGAAHLVIVRNEVDADLDLNTLEILGSSHPNLLEQNGRELKWIFPDIELASAGVDERASHGYVKFRLRPRADAPAGAVITNSAEIFFDYNAPITTIVTTNTITDNPLPVAAFRVVPQRGSAGRTNDFLYTGGTPGAQYQWYFGPNAIPQTSTEMNPTGIVFTRPGRNLVSLRVALGDCVVQSPVKVITVGQPRLGITKAGREVALTWQGDGFVVQETESLAAPIPWRTLPAQPISAGSWNYITVPAAAEARFYRLTDTP